MSAIVYRFPPWPNDDSGRFGRIALSIDARQARRQYRKRRGIRGMTAGDARAWVIHVYCRGVDE